MTAAPWYAVGWAIAAAAGILIYTILCVRLGVELEKRRVLRALRSRNRR